MSGRRRIEWRDLLAGRPVCDQDEEVEIAGWINPLEPADSHSYFFLALEPPCCAGCPPSDPRDVVEVFAEQPISLQPSSVRIIGRWRTLHDDPAGWRYQLRDARLADSEVTRRTLFATGLAALATAAAPARAAEISAELEVGRRAIAGALTIDIHSHAARVNRPDGAFTEIIDPMREGGMEVVCLSFSADRPLLKAENGGFVASRQPEAGELYRWSEVGFARILQLARERKMKLVTDAAALAAYRSNGPMIVVSAEGADFLDGKLERLAAAYERYSLRHLQLTHYRVNELGDIQTVAPVHNGLTDFGVEVIRACNRMGIVVDIAHGTLDLVKRAASVTTKPLVLSHTSLTTQPTPGSRRITAEHARVVAETGGVIGIWPPTPTFRDKAAWAGGVARMVDATGSVAHVGLGSDMLGLLTPSVFASYRELPALAAALLKQGFNAAETSQILGGNYARVFAATVG